MLVAAIALRIVEHYTHRLASFSNSSKSCRSFFVSAYRSQYLSDSTQHYELHGSSLLYDNPHRTSSTFDLTKKKVLSLIYKRSLIYRSKISLQIVSDECSPASLITSLVGINYNNFRSTKCPYGLQQSGRYA